MKLIIYAHPDESSFNHALLETVKQTLAEHHQPFRVIDLYGEKFNPVLSVEELKGLTVPEVERYRDEIRKATDLIFIFPVWWFRGPAILEGFCDKVFVPGFAYRFRKIYGTYGLPIPMLRNKRVVAFITHGAPALPVKTMYFNAVKYRFLLGFLSFCFNLFRCRIYQFWAVPFVTDEKRKQYLQKTRRIIGRLGKRSLIN